MAELLPLSKAARLVGVKRDLLQKKIQEGELHTFEGMLELRELQRLFPDTLTAGSQLLEQMQEIKDRAAYKLRESDHDQDFTVLSKKMQELRAIVQQYQDRSYRQFQLLQTVRSSLVKVRDPAAQKLVALIDETQHYESPDRELEKLMDSTLYTKSSKETLVHLLPSGQEFLAETNDTLLNAALKSGFNFPYGCRDGSCGRCRVRVTTGITRQVRFHVAHLTAEEKSLGMIFACAYTALSDLEIEVNEIHDVRQILDQSIPVRVKTLTLRGDTCLLSLESAPAQRLQFLAGQTIALSLEALALGNFPVASCPCEERLIQIHIPHPESQLAPVSTLKINDPLLLTGPYGEFVLDTQSSRPLIFVVFEHLFAAVKGLVEQAIALDRAESVHLFWVGREHKHFYMDNLCRAWNDALDGFHYETIVIAPETDAVNQDEHCITGALDYITENLSGAESFHWYLALTPSMDPAARQFLLGRAVPASHLKLSSSSH